MEVMSCSSSQGAEQVETHGGLTMDEMLLDVDVEEAAVNESVLNPELDGLNAEKHSTTDVVIEETENLGGDNVEGESSSPSEPKWLQQDEPVALWVKVLIISLSLSFKFIWFFNVFGVISGEGNGKLESDAREQIGH